ncbi:unnamed protein product [Calypogeia fissa]
MNLVSVYPSPSIATFHSTPCCHLSTNAAGSAAPSLSPTRLLTSPALWQGRRRSLNTVSIRRCLSSWSSNRRVERGKNAVVSAGLGDFVGGDLLGFDLNKWYKDVEDYGSIAVYAPPEGGYEGRYATRLRQEGYHFMNITARGLGDPEAYLTKIHGVRPAHLGKQAIECFYYPPELDHRLSALPENSKGIVLWVIEAKVLSKTELQYLALLPALRKKVKVIAECGSWRSYRWKPLREVAGLPLTQSW